MKMLDARRLTGLNVIWDRPSAVVDIVFDIEENPAEFANIWRTHVVALLDAIGWTNEQTAIHDSSGGISLALSAPIDCLYAAVDLAEWAYETTQYELIGNYSEEPVKNFADYVEHLSGLIEDEKNPSLLELAKQAAAHDVVFLWDDDEASVGLGNGSITWPVDSLLNEIDWSRVHNIPVALVTGTNGKTTTVRLSTHILKKAGQTVGLSSTDWIGVNNHIIERGDYSGPGGARTVLRQTEIDCAVLETARGGLLRRGLGVQRADVALITNISEDHLGDFGSRSLKELLDIKWLVMQALDENSVAILNADDKLLVEKSTELSKPAVIWFSLDPSNPILDKHIASGNSVVTIIDGLIKRYDGKHWHDYCSVESIPITMNGIAKHNIANALASACMCHALGVADSAITAGLKSMTAKDNPGRCNLFRVDDFEVLLDFAHNPDAMLGLFDIASKRPARRRILCFGQAGDRTDELIKELAYRAWDIGLEHVIISELGDYLRGREEGEVIALLHDELVRAGAREDQISFNRLESESLDQALGMAQTGDLVIMLALSEAKELIEKLNTIGESLI
jgi:UDP-N-acetylmuramyl tripeptide synthase